MCKDCQQHRHVKVTVNLLDKKGNPLAITYGHDATSEDILEAVKADVGSTLLVSTNKDLPLNAVHSKAGNVHRVERGPKKFITIRDTQINPD